VPAPSSSTAASEPFSICFAISLPNTGEEGTMEPICRGFCSHLRRNKFVARGLANSSDDIDFDDIAESHDLSVQTALVKENDSKANQSRTDYTGIYGAMITDQ
jgi:hypothetical protein